MTETTGMEVAAKKLIQDALDGDSDALKEIFESGTLDDFNIGRF